MRVVFDTNILVSALIVPGGKAEEALLRVIEGSDRLVISKDILDELLGVLARKFGRDDEELARIAVFLRELADWVRPRHAADPLTDPADNRVLDCAHAGRAEAIVTGDREMLELQSYAGIPIVTLRNYLGRP